MASFFYLNLKGGAAIMDYGDLAWLLIGFPCLKVVTWEESSVI